MPHVLAFGGGVDSTALMCIHMNRDLVAFDLGISREQLDEVFPHFDTAVFSDPGAEFAHTYKNIAVAQDVGGFWGFRVLTVAREGETIEEWVLRNGTVPVMPGGPHVCSLKFKGEVMAKWAAKEYPGETVTWLVGIEAKEGHRVKRFQAKPGTSSLFPLVELGLDRQACQDICDRFWPTKVEKSSCFFCPFMSRDEIADLVTRPEWERAKHIETTFQATSAKKHQAWLDAGQPLNAAGRAPRGMWRKDSWESGQRLFVKRESGCMHSCEEWGKPHYRSSNAQRNNPFSTQGGLPPPLR